MWVSSEPGLVCSGPEEGGGGSKGQVWTRQGSLPSQSIACSTGQQAFYWLLCFSRTSVTSARDKGFMVQGLNAGSHISTVPA